MRDATSPVPPPAIDPKAWSNLESIADGDREFLITLIDQFLHDSALLVEAIVEGVEQGHAGELERAAHTLKSASANLGARALSAMCEELCGIARSGSLDEAQRIGLGAKQECRRACAELEARSAKLSAS